MHWQNQLVKWKEEGNSVSLEVLPKKLKLKIMREIHHADDTPFTILWTTMYNVRS